MTKRFQNANNAVRGPKLPQDRKERSAGGEPLIPFILVVKVNIVSRMKFETTLRIPENPVTRVDPFPENTYVAVYPV